MRGQRQRRGPGGCHEQRDAQTGPATDGQALVNGAGSQDAPGGSTPHAPVTTDLLFPKPMGAESVHQRPELGLVFVHVAQVLLRAGRALLSLRPRRRLPRTVLPRPVLAEEEVACGRRGPGTAIRRPAPGGARLSQLPGIVGGSREGSPRRPRPSEGPASGTVRLPACRSQGPSCRNRDRREACGARAPWGSGLEGGRPGRQERGNIGRPAETCPFLSQLIGDREREGNSWAAHDTASSCTARKPQC